MPQNEYSYCQELVAKSIQDTESAANVQDLLARLKSVLSSLESDVQECITIYEEVEQTANSVSPDPVEVSVPFDVEFSRASLHAMIDTLADALRQGEITLETYGIQWFAEEEKVNAVIDGQTVECWHMMTEGDVATVCLNYIGGPRREVPLSALSHIQEQV